MSDILHDHVGTCTNTYNRQNVKKFHNLQKKKSKSEAKQSNPSPVQIRKYINTDRE